MNDDSVCTRQVDSKPPRPRRQQKYGDFHFRIEIINELLPGLHVWPLIFSITSIELFRTTPFIHFRGAVQAQILQSLVANCESQILFPDISIVQTVKEHHLAFQKYLEEI
jgi:hypothetical protein